jgi:DNA-binding NtrC family response regulator
MPVVGAGANPRVLLIEDDPLAREVGSELLQRKGCSVRSADSADAAFHVWRAEGGRFDVILSDVNLPDMNGLMLLNEFRRERPNLSAVVITGCAVTDRQFDQIRSDRRTLLMQKPVDFARLAQQIALLAEQGIVRELGG